jgi:hypothetical protein
MRCSFCGRWATNTGECEHCGHDPGERRLLADQKCSVSACGWTGQTNLGVCPGCGVEFQVVELQAKG